MSVTVEETKNIGFLNLSLEEKIQINLWTPFEKCLDTPLILTIKTNEITDFFTSALVFFFYLISI